MRNRRCQGPTILTERWKVVNVMDKAKSWRKLSYAEHLAGASCRMPCLWFFQGGLYCRYLADPGDMYCPKHRKQWMDEMTEALQQPEKWVLVEEVIRGKTYRDLVYRP